MTVEVEVEAKLLIEAEMRGISVSALTADLLLKQLQQTQPLQRVVVDDVTAPLSPEERHTLIENHIAWMRERSPGWETADPYSLDWQAIKAEGRRY